MEVSILYYFLHSFQGLDGFSLKAWIFPSSITIVCLIQVCATILFFVFIFNYSVNSDSKGWMYSSIRSDLCLIYIGIRLVMYSYPSVIHLDR